jgi:hypothetical protein
MVTYLKQYCLLAGPCDSIDGFIGDCDAKLARCGPAFQLRKEVQIFVPISRGLKLFTSERGPRLVNKLEFSLRQL